MDESNPFSEESLQASTYQIDPNSFQIDDQVDDEVDSTPPTVVEESEEARENRSRAKSIEVVSPPDQISVSFSSSLLGIAHHARIIAEYKKLEMMIFLG